MWSDAPPEYPKIVSTPSRFNASMRILAPFIFMSAHLTLWWSGTRKNDELFSMSARGRVWNVYQGAAPRNKKALSLALETRRGCFPFRGTTPILRKQVAERSFSRVDGRDSAPPTQRNRVTRPAFKGTARGRLRHPVSEGVFQPVNTHLSRTADAYYSLSSPIRNFGCLDLTTDRWARQKRFSTNSLRIGVVMRAVPPLL